MKIVQLQSENVKRLRAVNIRPDGSLVVIKGNNGQGKTSVLDSIAYALGGKDIQPPKVIREGTDRAQVVVDLGDLTVIRRWTGNDKSYLEVKSKDGATYKSPQSMLDGLVGKLSFDPLAFTRLPPKEQADTLRRMVGIRLDDLEATRRESFDRRTDVNREVGGLRARLAAIPEVEAPDDLISHDALLSEQERLLTVKAQNDKLRLEHLRIKQAAVLAHANWASSQAELKLLEEKLEQAKQRRAELWKKREEGVEAEKVAAETCANLSEPDLGVVKQRIREVEATNEKVRQRRARAELVKGLAYSEAVAKGLTDELGRIDAEKASRLAAAKFPVEGLGFNDAGVTLNGLPLEQASSAEQLRVSLAMGLALNPKLKVMLVRDGSLLDENSLALVAKMAEETGAQVWIEMVGTAGQVGVLIEDGQAFGPETEQPPAPEAKAHPKKGAFIDVGPDESEEEAMARAFEGMT